MRNRIQQRVTQPFGFGLDQGILGADGELVAYLDARCATVTSLVSEVSDILADQGTRLAFIDFSGGIKGYLSGAPAGAPAAAIGWQFGIDLDEIKDVCPEVVVLGYAADPERVRLDLEAYTEQLANDMTVVLRPMLPDCTSADNFAEKVGHVRALGIERLAFHHYGLMRLEGLDWIREALRQASAA